MERTLESRRVWTDVFQLFSHFSKQSLGDVQLRRQVGDLRLQVRDGGQELGVGLPQVFNTITKTN